jgi:hypothetical protein
MGLSLQGILLQKLLVDGIVLFVYLSSCHGPRSRIWVGSVSSDDGDAFFVLLCLSLPVWSLIVYL